MKNRTVKNVSGGIREDIYIIHEYFDRRISVADINSIGIVEAEDIVHKIHWIMQRVVTKKFAEMSGEEPEQIEKSAFDEYDEENGYNDALEIDVWKICEENINRIIDIAIQKLGESYSQCMSTDIIELLNFIGFKLRDKD